MLVIGLTGGIGSGKSTAADYFSALGVPVIDADEISHALTRPHQPALARITEAFGSDILDMNGALDRGQLRALVFEHPDLRKKLEAILHPLIRNEMHKLIETIDAPYCILSIPLLFETEQQDMVDRVLVIDAPPELQIKRSSQRDKRDEEELEAILGAQMDRKQRLSLADDVIVNDSTLDSLKQKVETLHRKYLEAAKA